MLLPRCVTQQRAARVSRLLIKEKAITPLIERHAPGLVSVLVCSIRGNHLTNSRQPWDAHDFICCYTLLAPRYPSMLVLLIPNSRSNGTASCWCPEANSHPDPTGIAKGRQRESRGCAQAATPCMHPGGGRGIQTDACRRREEARERRRSVFWWCCNRYLEHASCLFSASWN
jgi:hypothetical protein